ncbi:hypothetical protein TNCT_147201 [Trichonephila clavata]|uniref:Uncharacterized protein n=1 Tax=Trichonephila clavata TaxID=2740835 RepID=A0A8X6I696_TRICU|nr:hypothetical protein TNCT_147201 [Trichonephila clavata]
MHHTIIKHRLICSVVYSDTHWVKSLKLSEDNMDLLSLMEKPLKYISELASQLETLLSCTAVGHRDYVCLESIVSSKLFNTSLLL